MLAEGYLFVRTSAAGVAVAEKQRGPISETFIIRPARITPWHNLSGNAAVTEDPWTRRSSLVYRGPMTGKLFYSVRSSADAIYGLNFR